MLYQTTRSPELVGEVWRSVSHLATQEFTRFSDRIVWAKKESKLTEPETATQTGDRRLHPRVGLLGVQEC